MQFVQVVSAPKKKKKQKNPPKISVLVLTIFFIIAIKHVTQLKLFKNNY